MHEIAETSSALRRIAKRARILYVDHTAELGGGEIALLNLIRHLDRKKYEPIALLFSEGPLRDRLVSEGIETHVLPLASAVLHVRKDTLGLRSLSNLGRIKSFGMHIGKLCAFLKTINPDIIHSNSLKADIISGIAGRIQSIPVIWHIRDRITDDYLPTTAASLFRLFAKLIPNFVIANSNSTMQALQFADGASEGRKQFVALDGVDLSAFDHRCSYQSSDQPVRIALIGRISPWKGQHIFIEAAATVHREFKNTQFLIVGSPLFGESAYAEEIRSQVSRLGLDGAVKFLGFRSDVERVICSVDIVVHASTIGEPFGQVIVEGMAAGKPIVATRGGGVPEIVNDGETGILVPMMDAPSMASAIRTLVSDEELRHTMGRAAYERARDHFSIQNTAKNVESVYNCILLQNRIRQN